MKICWPQHVRISLLVSISWLLVACGSPQVVIDLTDYRSRISRILDVPVADISPTISLQFPDGIHLRLDIPKTSINLRDFYALGDCHVSTLIAERNTALGKAHLPSTRFVYELSLIEGLQTCVISAKDEKQRQQLNKWLEIKRNNKSLAWANLIQNSDEIRTTLSNNQTLFSDYDPALLVKYEQAFEFLLQLINESQVDASLLENSLNTLRLNPLLAEVWRTQRLISKHLEQTTHILRAASLELQCDSSQSRQKAEYLANVFKLFFVERLQPLASDLNQITYLLSPHLQVLQDHPALSPAFKQYLNLRSREFEDYQNTIKQHVILWQVLFKQCGISPKDFN